MLRAPRSRLWAAPAFQGNISESYRIDPELVQRWQLPSESSGTRAEEMRSLLEGVVRGERAVREIPHDLRGLELREAKLRGIDLSGRDLAGVDFSRADLRDANFFGSKLVGSILFEAQLERAELTATDLSGANLEGVDGGQAGFGGAKLTRVRFFNARLEGAVLSKAHLEGADLRCVRLREARFCGANLRLVDLSGADLRDADLEGARVAGANFHGADLRGARVANLQDYQHAQWIGVDIRGINFTGGYLFRRHVLDANFLAEFRARSRTSAILYQLWWLTSDCGRSLLRWGITTASIALLFAALYTLVDVDYGPHPTPISGLYFSLVTLTTLGFGDAFPASVGAQIITMIEVVLGYVMLGGLLSIFASKMARRAD